MQEQQTPPPPLGLNRFDYLVLGLIAISFVLGTLFVLLSYFEFQRLFSEFNRSTYEWNSDTHLVVRVFWNFYGFWLSDFICVVLGIVYLIRGSVLRLKAAQTPLETNMTMLDFGDTPLD